MEIVLVVAIADNGVIGVDGKLPWSIPEDLKHFRRITMGYPILMGRKTFDSIGKPLPGRMNIVLTRDTSWRVEGVVTVNSLQEAINAAAPFKKLMVIGGGEIYDLMLPYATRLEVTEIDLQPEGDTKFKRPQTMYWKQTNVVYFLETTRTPAFKFVSYVVRKRLGRHSFLNRKTIRLMELFASGQHIPGSGSAASLMGLLSATLILTVVDLTRQKSRTKLAVRALDLIEHQVSFKAIPELVSLFEDDSAAFDEVMRLRLIRDSATSHHTRKIASDQHLRRMRRATEIPIRTAAICQTMTTYAEVLLEIGYKAARGDSGAALAAALAGWQAAIFVVQTNLRNSKDGAWARRTVAELRNSRTDFWRAERNNLQLLLPAASLTIDENQPELFSTLPHVEATDRSRTDIGALGKI